MVSMPLCAGITLHQPQANQSTLEIQSTGSRTPLLTGETYARPMLANARAMLIEHLRDAHRWLDALLSDPRLTLESLASREGKTMRSIRMKVSLAFLAPEIVKAAVEGRLPRGFGLKRLVDLPMAWPDQWRAPELSQPTPGHLLDKDYLTSTGETVPRPGVPQSSGETPFDRNIRRQNDRIDNSICSGC
jgi:hypothetical protein